MTKENFFKTIDTEFKKVMVKYAPAPTPLTPAKED